MNNKNKIKKILALLLLAIVGGVFTHCMPQQTGQLNYQGESVYRAPTGAPSPQTEGQVLNEMQVGVGIKNFEQIFHTMATLTGVDPFISQNASARAVYSEVEISLPSSNDLKVFLPANQIAVSRLAAEYCHLLIDEPINASSRAQVWEGIDFNTSPNNLLNQASREIIVIQTIDAFWGEGMLSRQAEDQAINELLTLMADLLVGESQTSSATTRKVIKGVCTAALSSAYVTLL